MPATSFSAMWFAQATPEIGIVGLDADPERGLRLVEQLSQTVPQCDILVTSASNDGNLILQAMRAGAKEFLTWPVRLEDLLACAGTNQRSAVRPWGQSPARLPGNRSGRHLRGVGSTGLAVNLACALAARDQNSVVLVDLDLTLGDADVLLDTMPDYTIADLAQNINRLDYTLLKRSLTRHSSGLYLLPRPLQLEDIPLVNPDEFQRIVGLLKATFTHLVLDLSKAFSPLDMIALEMANHILLVTQLELASLRNVVRLLASLSTRKAWRKRSRSWSTGCGLDVGQITLKKRAGDYWAGILLADSQRLPHHD